MIPFLIALLMLMFFVHTYSQQNQDSSQPILTGQFRADYLSTSTIDESIYEDEFTMDIILNVGISVSWLYF